MHDGEQASRPRNERQLQRVWLHQRIARSGLRLIDGTPLRVLHPGFWNREAGPDFLQAVLQFGSDSPRTGAVEIDLIPSGWTAHAHATNPAYTGVILHVVWDSGTGTRSVLPTFELNPWLDAPWSELESWLGRDLAGLPRELAGRCAEPLAGLELAQRKAVLLDAARARLRRKACEVLARARHAGWRQALLEGMLGALGYKHNVWPMRRLAELAPDLCPARSAGAKSIRTTQALLLGIAGLLPAEMAGLRPTARGYTRELWDVWWREKAAWDSVLLPPKLWRLHGLRPANRPERRLALAAHWLHREDLPARLDAWLANPSLRPVEPARLNQLLQAEPDEFWESHWTLRSRRLSTAIPLLGPARTTDLAMNIVLPWLWARAQAGKQDGLVKEVEGRYLGWPAGQDNALLRLARQRLLGDAPLDSLGGAAAQQGLLQILQDFCEHSNALCEHCDFPQLVRALSDCVTAPDC